MTATCCRYADTARMCPCGHRVTEGFRCHNCGAATADAPHRYAGMSWLEVCEENEHWDGEPEPRAAALRRWEAANPGATA